MHNFRNILRLKRFPPSLQPVAPGVAIPLSLGQRRVWLLNELEAASPFYHAAILYQIEGLLSVPLLEAALNGVIARQAVLRTVLTPGAAEPTQTILPYQPHPIRLFDLTAVAADQQETTFAAQLAATFAEPFDLTRLPLIRPTLWSFAPDNHTLLLLTHQFVVDDGSKGLLMQELQANYAALRRNQPLALPDLPVQYADFAHWQRTWLQGEVLEAQLAYWRDLLGRPLPVLDFPFDQPRTALRSYQNHVVPLAIPAPLAAQLTAFTQQQNATVFTVLLAALNALLYAYTGQNDILVISTTSGRNHFGELKQLLGLFANPLIVRTALRDRPTFHELVADVRQGVLAAYACQDVPLEQLAGFLPQKRGNARLPLFQVTFSYQDEVMLPTGEWEGLQWQPIKYGQAAGKSYDLAVDLSNTRSGLQGSLTYNGDLFLPVTVTQIADDFVNLLATLLNDPAGALPRLDRVQIPTNATPATVTAPYRSPQTALETSLATLLQKVCHLEQVGVDTNFFDLGASSLLLIEFHNQVQQHSQRAFPITKLFEFATIRTLARFLHNGDTPKPAAHHDPNQPLAQAADQSIAIIGMACRAPGATTPQQFWQNLRDGVESISHLSDVTLLAQGVDQATLHDPNYVKARGCLDDVAGFDAAFFDITAREAQILDPQHRHFLECVWEALEDAGIDPQRYSHPIGVYAGAGINTYLAHIHAQPELYKLVGHFLTSISNEKDNLATRVSYKLGLRGPSLSIQTACSTSLVAVHLACQALLTGECGIALAGGVAIDAQQAGYFYQKEGIYSPDGHCRAFDAAGQGTVFGSGVGVVVLKRLADALADGDPIHAVIKGSAINNDGATKVGYTAPSVEGQSAVVQLAQARAGVAPETITYVEAHGTGTALGDPIEVAALTQAFQRTTQRRQFCALGTVKSNVGHLDAAAGVTGLIKTVLALQHQQLPPTLHIQTPSPKIDWAGSPFYLNTQLTDWPRHDTPRRAGVSSFGVGGTNAHVIVEEAPAPTASDSVAQPQLLPLSAQTPSALDAACRRLADHLQVQADHHLADVAYTLQRGRSAFAQRHFVVADRRADAVAALSAATATPLATLRDRPLFFLFPGQGAQHVNMGRGLYESRPLFRETVDHCAMLLAPHLQQDLRHTLYPTAAEREAATARLTQTSLAQPALFIVSYALAQLWQRWGIRPQAMLGHSIGEYVAACLAGVLSLPDALRLVVQRGALMQALPPGAMVTVALSEAAVQPYLNAEIALAAVNEPTRTVLAGSSAAVAQLEARLMVDGVQFRRLHTSHAFHSPLMAPLSTAFVEQVAQVQLHAPQIPYCSCVTGDWITPAQATDPAYYYQQLRQPVRFAVALAQLWAAPTAVCLEVGAGQTLTTFAQRRATGQQLAVASLGHPQRQEPDDHALLTAAGKLWQAGVDIDWAALHQPHRRRRVSLPTYPFEHQRHWVDTPTAVAQAFPDVTSDPVALVRDLRQSVQPESAPLFSQQVVTQPMMTHPIPTRPMIPAAPTQQATVAAQLRQLWGDLLGLQAETLPADAPFLELGADSLLLVQASQKVTDCFGVQVGLGQLMEEITTLNALTAYVAAQLPPDPTPSPQPERPLDPATPPVAPSSNGHTMPVVHSADSTVAQIINRQLDLMAEQLAVLRGAGQTPPVTTPEHGSDHGIGVVSKTAHVNGHGPTHSTIPNPQSPNPAPSSPTRTSYVPYQPATPQQSLRLTDQQQAHLAQLQAAVMAQTPTSKRITQDQRAYLASNRAMAGFRLAWKEMIYPIIAQRSAGARMWDVDGNEYIDLAMGFGVNFLGYSPAFVTEALTDQLQDGIQVGPRNAIAGEVAALICELTGVERVTFTNSGTEAVMAAMRIARTVTGRPKIAVFAGSYHGFYDGTLGVPSKDGSAVPMAPGILNNMVADLLILDYATPQSLAQIKAHAGALAGVMVEAVQSRNPDLQPKVYLHQLRELTQELGITLIIDEVISGFRCHLGGAQAFFGVQADLVTYGKVLGGGLPIGVVAGKAAWMDALDGGFWQFGDGSYPTARQTFLAGTFCEHPLAMRAAKATLTYLKNAGPDLQATVNQRTTKLATTLNAFFTQQDLPIHVAHFSSLFRFEFGPAVKYDDFLFYHLLTRGVYTWEGRNCFLSTAHSDEDVAAIIHAVKESVAALQAGRFLPVNLPSSLPLTAAQQDLWVVTQQSEVANRAYNETTVLHLAGPLDQLALQQALQTVVNRHDVLRACFDAQGAFQEIAPTLAVELPLLDFSPLDAITREQQIAEARHQLATAPFDLTQTPLFRFALIRERTDNHLLVMTIHHLLVDGLSFAALIAEIAALYAAQRTGQPAALRPALPFGEYVQWLAQQAAEPAFQTAEQYWLTQFAAPPPALDLPTDHVYPALQSYNGAQVTRVLDQYDALKRLGQSQGATLFMTLLAGFNLLIHRLSGQDDLVLGIPVARRPVDRQYELIGYCLNLLPMRSQISAGQSAAAYLAQVKQTLLAGLAQQRYPFGRLVRQLNLARDASRPTLSSVSFNLDQVAERLTAADLTMSAQKETPTSARFELEINVVDNGQQLLVECTYNRDLFDSETIERWLGHYQTLLHGMVADPMQPVAELPLVTACERQQLLVEWNDTASDYPADKSFADLFEMQAARTPDAPAVTCQGVTLTYQELNERSNQLAHQLLTRGVGRHPQTETLVAVCLERSLEMLIALLAVQKAGGAYVPLDPAFPSERLALMINEADVRVVLTTSALSPLLPQPDHHLYVEQGFSQQPSSNPVRYIGPHHLAYCIFTSGSTGKPKGVLIEQRALSNFLCAMQQALLLTTSDRLLAVTTIAFDIAALELYLPLLVGAQLMIATETERADGFLLAQRLANSGATMMQATPATWRMLLAAGWRAAAGLTLLCGGEALPQDLAQQLLATGATLWNVYGPTETTIWSTAIQVTPAMTQRPLLTIGRPIGNTAIYLLDAHGQPAPIGVQATLYIGGDGVARGYLNRAELTQERFVANPFDNTPFPAPRLYNTGDLARYLPDGTIEFLGRRDHQVKLRGFRVELGEIEAVLSQHAAVEQSAVVVRDATGGEKVLVAYVTGAPALAAAELQHFLAQKLPYYMLPNQFVQLDQLPLTPNGKIDRRALPDPALSSPARTYMPPRTPMEEMVAALFAEVLGVAQVGVHDNFFGLGGHSLKAVQVVHHLRTRHQITIAQHWLFTAPTVAELAARIAEQAADAKAVVMEEFEL